MGVAYWEVDSQDGEYVPDHAFLLHAPRFMDLTNRALWLARQLDDRLMMVQGIGHHVVCEYPSYHGSIRGWATGDLQKLVLLVGVLVGYFHLASWTLVTPAGWKGQLSKEVVIRRLQKRFGPGATNDWTKDCWDAVGIGLWKMGRF